MRDPRESDTNHIWELPGGRMNIGEEPKAALARELKEKGADVISLSLGQPDFDTPEHIIDAAKIVDRFRLRCETGPIPYALLNFEEYL